MYTSSAGRGKLDRLVTGPPNKQTVAALVKRFLATLDQAVDSGRSAPATRDHYRYQLVHLVRRVGDRDAATLTSEDVSACPYTRHFVACCRRLFRWAEEAGYIEHNRFTHLAAPRCGQRTRTITREEFHRLMIVAPPALRRAVWFMKYTLARPGEMRGLRWREVDLAGRVVRLSRFKCMHKRRDGVRERVIPLVALVVRYLSWLKSRTRPDPDDFVYLNAWSRPWTMNMFRLAMHRACEEAGINDDPNGERIVAYSLRHTGATEATRQGIRDRTLADIMGHTSTNTTARYQHLDKTDLIDALERSMRNQRR